MKNIIVNIHDGVIAVITNLTIEENELGYIYKGVRFPNDLFKIYSIEVPTDVNVGTHIYDAIEGFKTNPIAPDIEIATLKQQVIDLEQQILALMGV